MRDCGKLGFKIDIGGELGQGSQKLGFAIAKVGHKDLRAAPLPAGQQGVKGNGVGDLVIPRSQAWMIRHRSRHGDEKAQHRQSPPGILRK